MIDSLAYKNLVKLCTEAEARLIAVSKTRTEEEVKALYDLGQRDFGENRIEEINRKSPILPTDIRWHLIGPLQSRKVKLFQKDIHMFHALDREKIWRKLDEWALENEVVVSALLQIHIAKEESKHGFSIEELETIISEKRHLSYPNVVIKGLMGMATNTDDEKTINHEFEELRDFFERIKSKNIFGESFSELSMGMSGDYEIALSNGATMIRIGSMIFGPRTYDQ